MATTTISFSLILSQRRCISVTFMWDFMTYLFLGNKTTQTHYAIKANTKRNISAKCKKRTEKTCEQAKEMHTYERQLCWAFFSTTLQSITNTIRYKLCVLTVSSSELSLCLPLAYHHKSRRSHAKRLHNLLSNEFKLFFVAAFTGAIAASTRCPLLLWFFFTHSNLFSIACFELSARAFSSVMFVYTVHFFASHLIGLQLVVVIIDSIVTFS